MKAPSHLHIAVGLIAAACIFVMGVGWRLVSLLSDHGWCSAAIGADKALANPNSGASLSACIGLMTLQVHALAINSYMALGVIALCLLVLVAIVIAGARVSLDASPRGAHLDLARQNDAPLPPPQK